MGKETRVEGKIKIQCEGCHNIVEHSYAVGTKQATIAVICPHCSTIEIVVYKDGRIII